MDGLLDLDSTEGERDCISEGEVASSAEESDLNLRDEMKLVGVGGKERSEPRTRESVGGESYTLAVSAPGDGLGQTEWPVGIVRSVITVNLLGLRVSELRRVSVWPFSSRSCDGSIAFLLRRKLVISVLQETFNSPENADPLCPFLDTGSGKSLTTLPLKQDLEYF
jgi:hypothetical protein